MFMKVEFFGIGGKNRSVSNVCAHENVNFNHQIIPYGILFLAFIIKNVFYLLSFKFSR
jgi:hypothetical protein